MTSGTWYFSFAVQLTDISTLNGGGVFWAGFNNSAGTQTTTPTSVGTRVLTRSSANGYNIGLDKTLGQSGSFVWDSREFTTNDVLFVVGAYTFNSGSSTDDVSQLWINPAPGTFGQAVAPPATLTSTASNDIRLRSFQASYYLTATPTSRRESLPMKFVSDRRGLA